MYMNATQHTGAKFFYLVCKPNQGIIEFSVTGDNNTLHAKLNIQKGKTYKEIYIFENEKV